MDLRVDMGSLLEGWVRVGLSYAYWSRSPTTIVQAKPGACSGNRSFCDRGHTPGWRCCDKLGSGCGLLDRAARPHEDHHVNHQAEPATLLDRCMDEMINRAPVQRMHALQEKSGPVGCDIRRRGRGIGRRERRRDLRSRSPSRAGLRLRLGLFLSAQVAEQRGAVRQLLLGQAAARGSAGSHSGTRRSGGRAAAAPVATTGPWPMPKPKCGS